MEFNRFFLREPVHDQQLIQRIAQWIRGKASGRKGRFTHLQGCASETAVDEKALVRRHTKQRSIKIKLKAALAFIKSPCGSGIEDSASRHWLEPSNPLDVNLNVGRDRFGAKRLKGRNETDVCTTVAVDFDGQSANTELTAMRAAEFERRPRQLFELASHFLRNPRPQQSLPLARL